MVEEGRGVSTVSVLLLERCAPRPSQKFAGENGDILQILSVCGSALLFFCRGGWEYWAIQRSWFARVNVLCNLSRKMSREVAAHFRADFGVGVASRCV